MTLNSLNETKNKIKCVAVQNVALKNRATFLLRLSDVCVVMKRNSVLASRYVPHLRSNAFNEFLYRCCFFFFFLKNSGHHSCVLLIS